MIKIGNYNTLKVIRRIDFGYYLDDGENGILLPNRFTPKDLKVGDNIDVFIYHDSEDRIIATTEHPKGIVGDIVLLRCISTTKIGAFLDWGLMKDLLIPNSQQLTNFYPTESYLVKIYLDEKTHRIAATQKFERELNNEQLTVKELEQVTLITYRKTDIGYVMIINNRHTGILHTNEIFGTVKIGEPVEGFIKNILPENKIDVALGKPGYQRVEDETKKIIDLLKKHNGFLPYYDKSDPQEIYAFFGMSKKTFKMTIGALYKQRIIRLENNGISLITED